MFLDPNKNSRLYTLAYNLTLWLPYPSLIFSDEMMWP